MRLLFIRHGDPDYERDCLNELGLREAKALKSRVDAMTIDRAVVSPFGRASETAKVALGLAIDGPIPETVNRPDGSRIPASTEEWAREFDVYKLKRPDLGGVRGCPWDWLPADWTKYDEFYDPVRWLENPIVQDSEVPKRYHMVCNAIDSLLAEYGYIREGRTYRVERESRATVAVFTHYGLTCVALSHLLNISPMQLWHGICMCPASITAVTTEERRQGVASFRTECIGDYSHLYTEGMPFNTNARFAEIYSAEEERHD